MVVAQETKLVGSNPQSPSAQLNTPLALYGSLSYSEGMSKTERIELRVSSDDKDAIESAAEMEHTNTTDFVRDAVLERVQHVRARADRTLMPAEQFDTMMESIDAADNTPTLARAFAHKRRFLQR